jgi:hypothetical protein
VKFISLLLQFVFKVLKMSLVYERALRSVLLTYLYVSHFQQHLGTDFGLQLKGPLPPFGSHSFPFCFSGPFAALCKQTGLAID